jgi:hypothetical protein
VDQTDPSADLIRRQMREIRKDLRNDVSEVVSGANQLLDWKSHLRRNPWLVLGSAAVAGYLMIPRRSREVAAVVATRESIDNLAQEVRSHSTLPQNPTSPLLGFMMPVLSGILLRVGTACGAQLTEQILDSFKSRSTDPANEPTMETVGNNVTNMRDNPCRERRAI